MKAYTVPLAILIVLTALAGACGGDGDETAIATTVAATLTDQATLGPEHTDTSTSGPSPVPTDTPSPSQEPTTTPDPSSGLTNTPIPARKTDPSDRLPLRIDITCPGPGQVLAAEQVSGRWRYAVGGSVWPSNLPPELSMSVVYRRMGETATDWTFVYGRGVKPAPNGGFLVDGWVGNAEYPGKPGEQMAVAVVFIDDSEGNKLDGKVFDSIDDVPGIGASFSRIYELSLDPEGFRCDEIIPAVAPSAEAQYSVEITCPITNSLTIDRIGDSWRYVVTGQVSPLPSPNGVTANIIYQKLQDDQRGISDWIFVDSGGAQVHEDGQFYLEGFIGDSEFPPKPGEKLAVIVALVDTKTSAEYDRMIKVRPYLFEAVAYSLPRYLQVRNPQDPEYRCPVVGTGLIRITCPTSNSSLPVYRVIPSWRYDIGGTLDRAPKENEGIFVAYKRLEGPSISVGGTDWILIDKPGTIQPLISAGQLTGKWEYLAEGWIGDTTTPPTPGELIIVSAVLMDKTEGRRVPNREFRTLESIPTIVSFSPAVYLRLADGKAGQDCIGAELDAPVPLPSQPRNTTFVDEFDFQNIKLWHKADRWSNGGMFWGGWRADHVEFSEGSLILRLDDQFCSEDEVLCSGQPYASGEYRTNDNIGFGCVEGRLKAAKGNGIVTALFSYTGPSEGNPHDEVDIEILGKDTTKVQVNYFVNGQGNHEKVIELGFDAAEEFHVYGFKWQPDTIKWYVDEKLVYSVTNANGSLPTTPGKIIMSLWPGIGVNDWLGEFVYPGAPIHAYYDWVKFSPSECVTTP